MDERALFLALAFRSSLPEAERWERIVEGPNPWLFDKEVLDREARDLTALDDLGVRIVTPRDDIYPERLRAGMWPLVMQVAGRAHLLDQPGVAYFGRVRGPEGERLADTLDGGGKVVVVLSKGMLRARTLLRGLEGPIGDGICALVSVEPPRASWGPIRDHNRDRLLRSLRPEA